VLDTITSLLQLLVTRDLDVGEVADDAGDVRVVLVLPSWDDYLRTALADRIESAAQSPMVLLQARIAPSFSIWARVIMTRSYPARGAGWCVTSAPAPGKKTVSCPSRQRTRYGGAPSAPSTLMISP